MYNTKFIVKNGEEIFPGYFNKEKREQLKKQFNNKREFMWCGCREDQKLYYRLSEDLKIYPEHNNYIHDKYCSRYQTKSGEPERKTAYVINEEDGEVTAYLTFNPKKLETNIEVEKEEDNTELSENELEESETEATIEKEEVISKKEEKKEPKLSLKSLIRSINIDTYTERILNDWNINSKESFSKCVYHRIKKIRASRMKKPIGELTLETDSVRFVYLPFAGAIKKENKGLTKCYICNTGLDGRVYNNFIFPDTLKKVVQEFAKTYGIEPDENTMFAGFQYYKTTRSGIKYKVLGRIHIFQVSNTGLYCRSLVEMDTFNLLSEIVHKDKNIKFWIPPDDESIGGIIQVKDKKRKILLLFKSNQDERITFNENLYDPLVVGESEPLNEQLLYQRISLL